ncbi:MAG: bacillithiol biosynthesis cysteine-adding enzyme BshC [Acidobacteriaceae bacterium]
MSAECYPITVLPHISALFRDYLAMSESAPEAPVRGWFGGEPFGGSWMSGGVGAVNASGLAEALEVQSREFGAGAATLANIERLRHGARAVVTGQQVGLLGGPLLTLLKAATAVARAREATRLTGVEHVPVFWLATEDHDLVEVDQVSLLTKTSVETLRAGLAVASAAPVGGVELGAEVEKALDTATELLGWAPVSDLLRQCYGSREGYAPTLGGAFARYMTAIFAEQGLIVMDAAGREFHTLGASTLRFALEHADELEEALLTRSSELEAAGYHAQVKVASEMSLLFLITDSDGLRSRQALRRSGDGAWKAGRQSYATEDLLRILEEAPERLSPNALLRPVFQDTILPTAAYVGGPAEIAYFAQSAVLYERILGRVTPVLPRLTATLLEPAIAAVMDRDEVQLPDAMRSAEELAQRLGARAMPIELKRRLASAGKAMDTELDALLAYLGGMDASLGRSGEVSGSKIRYQMNRLRRLAATHELEKEASLRKHADAITLNVFPGGHPQERVIAGAWYLARYEGLPARLVEEAKGMCGGHAVVRL